MMGGIFMNKKNENNKSCDEQQNVELDAYIIKCQKKSKNNYNNYSSTNKYIKIIILHQESLLFLLVLLMLIFLYRILGGSFNPVDFYLAWLDSIKKGNYKHWVAAITWWNLLCILFWYKCYEISYNYTKKFSEIANNIKDKFILLLPIWSTIPLIITISLIDTNASIFIQIWLATIVMDMPFIFFMIYRNLL